MAVYLFLHGVLHTIVIEVNFVRLVGHVNV